MTTQIFFFFVYVFEAIIAFVYFNENYKLKRTNISTIIFLIGLYIAAFAVNIIDNNLNIVNDIMFFTINLLFSKLCFDISIKSSIFHSSFLLAVMFLTELVAEAGTSYFLHIPIDAYKNNFTALFIIGTISKTLYLIVCKIVSSLFSYKNTTESYRKKNYILFLYPIIITITLTTFLYASTKYEFTKALNLICVIISIVSLLFCCFIFIYNNTIQKQENELINLQSEQQRNEMNQVFYEMLEKKNEEQRILVHDIKHHFTAINSMDNISDIKKYITNVQPELDEHKYIGKTKNKMFDLILDRYSSICSNKAIEFIVDIRASNLDFIEDNDLVSMLSNLLDNAVEATDKINNSTIRFSTKKDKSFIIITVINTCLTKPKSNGEKLITTKSNSSYHGYGIKSIEKTIKKYNGICQWDFDEVNKEFHFNILFNKK